MDPLSLFGRKDKWFLGSGTGAVFAPPFPKFLLAPGYWDECYFADIRIDKLFTVFFLLNDKPLRLSSYLKGWRPDRLIIMHVAGKAVIRETRCITENNCFVSEFELVTDAPGIELIVWSLRNSKHVGNTFPIKLDSQFELIDNSIIWTHTEAWPEQVPVNRCGNEFEFSQFETDPETKSGHIWFALTSNAMPAGHSIITSEKCEEVPAFEVSPISELFVNGSLRQVNSNPSSDHTHLLLHYPLTDKKPIQIGCAVAISKESVQKSAKFLQSENALLSSTTSWKKYFSSVPQFECSDPFFTNAYWNRWFGLRLNTTYIESFTFPYPCVFEGIGAFRNLTSYSSPAHIRETSWMHSSEIAVGELLTHAQNLKKWGQVFGHTYSVRPSRDFYHADWASAAKSVFRRHGVSATEKAAIFEFLQSYKQILENTRCNNSLGVVEVWDQNETGQEYSPRYDRLVFHDNPWKSFRLLGVDANSYAFELWEILNQDTTNIMRFFELSFDESKGQFFDLNLDNYTKSGQEIATNFYPFRIESLISKELAMKLKISLFDEKKFWANFPVCSTSMSAVGFSDIGHWNNERKNCPWSGRVWPMINSHMVEALMNCSRFDPEYRNSAGTLLSKWMRMMSFNGDPNRPNSYEHYNPTTGLASTYRGVDDYMHSWINDLIIKYVCGFESDCIASECGLEWFEIASVPSKDGLQDRSWKRD